MKIIISHDVDHLHSTDHIFHDWIIEKFWIRAFLHLFQKKITKKTFLNRMKYPFLKRYERLQEIMDIDKKYAVPSTFFFGVRRGLGMSYGKKKAVYYIRQVIKQGFETGVHGIAFEDPALMKKEYEMFSDVIGRSDFGIRIHYVRRGDKTLSLLSEIGYLYDSTEFDKSGKVFHKPYKTGNMWEFPLYIMDGYILRNRSLKDGIFATKEAIRQAEEKGMPYCTILFHDYLYNKDCFPLEYSWYNWLIKYLKENRYEFISYKNAVKELEDIK